MTKKIKFPKLKTESLFLGIVCGLVLSDLVKTNPVAAVTIGAVLSLALAWYESHSSSTSNWHERMEKSIDSDPNQYRVEG